MLVCATLLISASSGAVAHEYRDTDTSDEETVAIQASQAEQLATVRQWTREERQAAKPLPFPGGKDGAITPETDNETLVEGTPGYANSGAPDAQADVTARKEFVEEWTELEKMDSTIVDTIVEDDATIFGTAGVYTNYRGNYYSQMHTLYPYKAVGKLYVDGGGWCSASVVSPNNIIATAAHCVYNTDSNTWNSGWTFVPADRNGSAPYGAFPWSNARVLNGWINAPNSTDGRRYDVALITLGNNSSGRPVTYYTGWLGRSWNHSSVQQLHATGYPGNLDSGRYTHICAAESFHQSTDILGMGCNMMHGSSGGPWLRAFKPYVVGSANYVNSVVSGGTPGSTWGNTFYGPRFSSSNIVPLCNDEGC